MAKESTSSRIPRLDGAGTRIPLPGSLRSATNIATAQQTAKSSLIMRAATASNASKRPTSFAALTPPFTNSASNLKKSSSGERINNAVNMVSKKTTTVLKKFFGKPQQKHPQHQRLISPVEQTTHTPDAIKSINDVTGTMFASTPRTTLMRSETFIRSQNDLNLLDKPTPTAMAQSTPAPTNLKPQQGKRIPLQITNNMDTTFTSHQNTYNARHLASSFDKTMDRTIGKTFNGSVEMCKTMTVVSPLLPQQKELRKSGITQLNVNQTKTLDYSPKYANLDIDMTKIIKSGKSLMNSPGIATPATDATFSNPGSSENLQMIEDVSVPSGFDMDVTLQPEEEMETESNCNSNMSLALAPPDKAQLKLPLNSTMNTSRLIDLTTDGMISPASQLNFLNITQEHQNDKSSINSTELLYLTHYSVSATTTPDVKPNLVGVGVQRPHSISPFSLKGAQSDLVLPTQTPDDIPLKSNVAAHAEHFYGEAQARAAAVTAMSLQDVSNTNQKSRTRFSFGMDLTESTLDCSIELIDVSLSSNGTALTGTTHMLQSPSMQHLHAQQQQQQQIYKKQSSFDMDESLGILTPDQMKEFLDSTTTNTNNMELPLGLSATAACVSSNKQQMSLHQIRMDQTPSPEELPLDPIEVKTDFSDIGVSLVQRQHQQQQAAFTFAAQQQQTQNQQVSQQLHLQTSSISTEPVSLHTDTELSKTDPIMTKSNVSKISTSFITSVTSVTSLDTGYQGDGEMSRPASRGASDHSPSNGPAARRSGHVSRQPSFNQQFQHQQQLPPIRRQDPMTDSDFFTESDADDLLHRGGDRRAQVIDGQLYNCPTIQAAASVFISEDPQMEDSCMESSGIFTDVENRCEEDLAQMRRQDTQEPLQDMSPDGEAEDSTETVKSNREKNGSKSNKNANYDLEAIIGQGQQLQYNSSSHTIPSSCSADRLSAATTLSNRTSYCSVDTNIGGECKSFSSLEEAFVDDQLSSCEFGKRTKSSAAGNTGNGVPHKSNTTQQVSSGNNNKPNGAHTAEHSGESPVLKKISRAHLKSGSGSCDSGSKAKQTKSIVNVKSKGSGSDNSKSASPTPLVRKVPHAPNKWDAVMNKIANNKAIIRKNYNDVKSKVSTTRVPSMGSGGGTTTPSTPPVRRTPTSALSSGGPTSPVTSANKNLRANKTTPLTITATSVTKKPTTDNASSRNGSPLHQAQQAAHSKRLLQGATKRGRSYSKDSQKSSQSDLSMASGAGSPKNVAKTPIRAAKKRDVRNLSISPTDLGPPPKAQQTANGASTRVKSSLITNAQKRVLSTTSQQNTPSSTSSNKSSSTSPINTRRSTVKINTTTTTTVCSNPPGKAAAIATNSAAVITKDSNRLSNIEQTIATGSITAPKNGIRTETATELKEIICNGQQQQQQQILQHNNNNNSISKATSESGTRTNSINSLPLVDLEQQHGKKVNVSTLHSTVGAMANILEKKSPPKLQTGRKTQFHKQQKASSEDKPIASRKEYLDPNELQQLRLVNRHSCNGRLDFESLQQQLSQSELIQKQQDKSVEAFGVLIQYLVYELDAFSCPKFKNESLKAKDTIQKTLHLLDEAKHTCTQLQDQLCDKEAYYAQREEELQNLHHCELEKARTSYSDLQQQAKEEIAGLENQLSERDLENQRLMSCYRIEMENKFAEQLTQIRAAESREHELQMRLAALDESTMSLQAKLTNVEDEAIKNKNEAAERDRALNARIVELTNELEMLQAQRPSPTHDRSRRDRSDLSHDEIAILRPTRSSYDSRVNISSPRAMPRASLPTELTRLESEVESLRCVLEMRQSEISRLNKQNEELLRDADDRAAMNAKISKLNADIEMLKSELEIKTEKEKEYQIQLDKIQKDVTYEKIKRTRLSFDNEALQWQLKQRSEQLQIVEVKLHETLNSSISFNGSMIRNSSHNHCSSSSQIHSQTDNVSPPLSPIIKGVIQKADSVAYVLEIDDETPEIAASKMVKRASSFRSIDRSQVTRRQLSLSANMNTNSSVTCIAGPNPLSQSMSAASVIRQHSSESAMEHNGRAHTRIRSRSVSIKDEPAITGATDSESHVSNELLKPMEKNNFCTSSPYSNNVRPRTSTLKVETIHDEHDERPLYKRLANTSKTSTQPRLITCDTSALNSGERLDERMLPSHPSLHDLKVPKQFQQIKEYAGEAMVSGANSEDEGCSASSDDLVSMHSSTSTDISAAGAPLNMLESAANMSLEQVLLLDKINSLSGTPMEMSWSDDVIESNELPPAAIAALNANSHA